ncbi:NAD-dependent epimerase/dehydratase family protein [Thermoflexus sp.]|uniref:NAD-dependent epimerase/dehydratase family protein n=1 Tax=Thermoflexus sp. TaxID=1969742 RepID=UPI0025DFAA06|nr:NAD-dependent epimerase/dehydratase family protein [Thermoflexus sp.]MDW8180558.1 NAD-dependent epimerase/dehydratase family protein [Anaerolineae bacterium]MCS6963131.1 NAD-dependent epimerase/dehydratase family protein [Thermoflexus sp.]MCS7351105.1 NAD-dependent epimerase/dehydratase family protein [Thermoflexus sp.]MCX7690475.1 NAD-dependent epimerase/dehydratase family protein [Thermoflexus sp.]MDW8185856.1 NAD-dependent epimerase/dehydratase family protein [Anaerolineae bacterium]
MRILITGGAGFLGAALANRLVREGHTVLALDDLSAGDPQRLDSRVVLARGDVRDVPRLWTLLQGVDLVYHLAARVSVPESILYPRVYQDVNVGGTVALLEAMRDAGVKRLVLASSGAVYGDQPVQPVHEELLPRPLSTYAVTKLAAEHFVRTLGRLWGFEVVILRIFNAYGPGQPLPAAHAPVTSRFLKQAVEGGTLVIFGDGTQTRDFVYVDDVVEALLAAGKRTDLNGEILNVGSGQEISVNELAEIVMRVVGRHVPVIHSPAQDGGVARLCADLRRAERLLGYRPRVFLEEGLRRMLQEDPRFRI